MYIFEVIQNNIKNQISSQNHGCGFLSGFCDPQLARRRSRTTRKDGSKYIGTSPDNGKEWKRARLNPHILNNDMLWKYF